MGNRSPFCIQVRVEQVWNLHLHDQSQRRWRHDLWVPLATDRTSCSHMTVIESGPGPFNGLCAPVENQRIKKCFFTIMIITVTATAIGNQCAHRPPDWSTPGIRRGVCLYLGPDRHFLQGAFDSGSPRMSTSLPAVSVVQRHRLLCVGYPWKRTIVGVFVCILSEDLVKIQNTGTIQTEGEHQQA